MNIQDLRKSPLFNGLSDDELQQLMDNAKPVSLRAGEFLMKQGDPGDAAFVVLKGEFEIQKQSGQSLIKIDVRNPGDVLGEMALLSRSPRSASVIAITDSETLCISQEAFENLLSTSSTATLAVLLWVMARLSQNDALLHQQERMAALGTLSAGLAQGAFEGPLNTFYGVNTGNSTQSVMPAVASIRPSGASSRTAPEKSPSARISNPAAKSMVFPFP